jgi:hypothetical protein
MKTMNLYIRLSARAVLLHQLAQTELREKYVVDDGDKESCVERRVDNGNAGSITSKGKNYQENYKMDGHVIQEVAQYNHFYI